MAALLTAVTGRFGIDARLASLRSRSRFGFDVLTLAGGTTIGQIVLACATPLLTRLYTTEDFGQVQTYLALYAFVFVIVAWRYELAVLLPASDAVSAAVVCVALLAVVATSAVCAVVLLLIPWSMLVPHAYQFLQPYRWLWPVTLIGGGVYLVIAQWAIRRGAYGEVTKTRIMQTGGQVGAQLLLAGRLHPGAWGLLVGDAIGRMAGSLRLLRAMWHRDRDLFRAVRFEALRSAARRYLRFPLISTVSALINTGGFVVPALMLASLFGSRVLGWYSVVDRVMGVPSVLIGNAASQVYAARAAALATTGDAGQATRFFMKTVGTIAALGVGPYLVLVFFAPPLFAFVFGASWREAGTYAAVLAIPQFVAFVASTVMPTLNILERQTWQLWWDTARLVAACGSLWIVARATGDARLAIGAYGVSIFVAYIVHGCLSYLAWRRAPITGGMARPASA